jgi:hypothetical protein
MGSKIGYFILSHFGCHHLVKPKEMNGPLLESWYEHHYIKIFLDFLVFLFSGYV